MPRKPLGDRALSVAERSRRKRERHQDRLNQLLDGLDRLCAAKTPAEFEAARAQAEALIAAGDTHRSTSRRQTG